MYSSYKPKINPSHNHNFLFLNAGIKKYNNYIWLIKSHRYVCTVKNDSGPIKSSPRPVTCQEGEWLVKSQQ